MTTPATGNSEVSDSELGGYAESMTEIESILASLQGDNVDIDTLAAKVTRASRLIEHCEGRLRATELSLQTVLTQRSAESLVEEDS